MVLSRSAVPRAFDRIATSYDRLTGANPGYRKHLEDSAARMELAPDARILDLCCGTGLSTMALRRVYPEATLVGLDASEGMLARARTKDLDCEWVLGDATDPSAAGVEGTFDGILMAYGLRNLPDPDRGLQNAFSLLAPGGVLALHEYALEDRRAEVIWNAVALGIIVPGGLLTAGSARIYRYLRRSVNEFDRADSLEKRMRRAGFRQVRRTSMSGWQRGIVHTFVGRRP
ncbi:MAG: class I SAM-dependent methyltransferase [Myxococcota bacterium]